MARIKILENRVQIKESKRVKKFVNRTYGAYYKKVVKALKPLEGKEVSFEEVKEALKEVQTRKERSLKKIFKNISLKDVPTKETFEAFDASVKARRFYKKNLKNKGIVPEGTLISLDKERKEGEYNIIISLSEKQEVQEEDIDDFF